MLSKNSSEDYFAGLFESRALKYVSISFSMLFSYIIVFVIYFAIWVEKHGSDARRTIVNLLFKTCWWIPLLWMLVIQQFDILRYFYGPLPIGLCYLNNFLKFFLTMLAVVLLDGIIIARYLLIFRLKNPAGIGYWCFRSK